MKLHLIILLFLIAPVCMAMHPTHLSVVNMELDKQTRQLSYTIRIFQDDYVYLLNYIYHDALHNNKKNAFDSTLIINYFNEAFVISAINNKLKPVFISQKNDEFDVWLSFQIQLDNLQESLTVENKILLELYSDQTNLLIFSSGYEENGLTFDAQNTTQPISIRNIL